MTLKERDEMTSAIWTLKQWVLGYIATSEMNDAERAIARAEVDEQYEKAMRGISRLITEVRTA